MLFYFSFAPSSDEEENMALNVLHLGLRARATVYL